MPADSFVLRNRQLLVAAKHYAKETELPSTLLQIFDIYSVTWQNEKVQTNRLDFEVDKLTNFTGNVATDDSFPTDNSTMKKN